jgi:hypothetical protein
MHKKLSLLLLLVIATPVTCFAGSFSGYFSYHWWSNRDNVGLHPNVNPEGLLLFAIMGAGMFSSVPLTLFLWLINTKEKDIPG